MPVVAPGMSQSGLGINARAPNGCSNQMHWSHIKTSWTIYSRAHSGLFTNAVLIPTNVAVSLQYRPLFQFRTATIAHRKMIAPVDSSTSIKRNVLILKKKS